MAETAKISRNTTKIPKSKAPKDRAKAKNTKNDN